MNDTMECTRRQFLKTAGCAAAVAAVATAVPGLVTEAQAAELDLVTKRQTGVYAADANPKLYKLRKSQDNPMITKIYAKDGFLHDGPCGHKSHELLHTHYVDRSAGIKALKAKGIKLKA
jgi:ferredoxin hydrogenase small subunit